jgi:hypothetical protein
MATTYYRDHDRPIIPLRPDPVALREAALGALVEACVYVAKNAGKSDRPRLDGRVEMLVRAPVAPTKIADAQALAHLAYEFVQSLTATSASGELIARSLRLAFDGRAQIAVPSIALSDAAWIGESSPIPMTQGVTSAGATISPYKLATGFALTNETLLHSDLEAMAKALLLESVAPWLDKMMLSATAGTTLRPPGILNGIAALTASTATGIDGLTADLQSIARALAPLASSSRPILIAAPEQFVALTTQPVAVPFDFYQSAALAAGTLIGVVPKGLCTVIEMPRIEQAPANVHMDSSALELVAVSPVTIAAPQRSGFQTDSVMLRFILPCTWALRSMAAVAWISGTKW